MVKNLRMKVDIIPWYFNFIKHLKRETSDEEEKLFSVWLKRQKNREIYQFVAKNVARDCSRSFRL